jgi:hypothetical protein
MLIGFLFIGNGTMDAWELLFWEAVETIWHPHTELQLADFE